MFCDASDRFGVAGATLRPCFVRFATVHAVCQKVSLQVWGRETAFGALLETLCATRISVFDFSLLIWRPGEMDAPRFLPEVEIRGVSGGEFVNIEFCAHGPSRKRQLLTVYAHVDRSLRGNGTANICRKQFGTIWSASGSVYDRKESKNDEK